MKIFSRFFPTILFGSSVFFLPILLHAQVVFSEIFYDATGADEGKEWVEVHNISNTSIDLSKWKFFEGGTNHSLTPFALATTSPGDFVVIASDAKAFLQDHVGFKGLLFDSSFSLSNKGELLALKNEKGVIIDSVTYTPQGESGQSLQRIAGNWIASDPTPAMENKESAPKVVAPLPVKTLSSGVPTSKKQTPPVVTEKAPSLAHSGTEKVVNVSLPQEKSQGGLWIWIVALGAIILATLIGLHVIEGKTVSKEEISLDNGLNASDFEIIEETDDK